MTRQRIYLQTWDWMVQIYYWAKPDDREEILSGLRRIGASTDTLRRASASLDGPMVNAGLAYTNDRKRHTILVIGETSGPGEFWNTLNHEVGHAAQHIGEHLGLDCRGEEIQYIAGELSGRMYPVAKKYM